MQNLELNNVIVDIKTILSKNPGQVKRVGVFGSLVKGKQHETSDIDIAIEYDSGENDEKYSFDSVVRFCEICETLSDTMYKIYNRKIDVVHIEERKGSFIDDIREDVIWI